MIQLITTKLTRYSTIIQICWITLVCASLAWNIYNTKHIAIKLAYSEAEANFLNDIEYRLWVAKQGGVYAPVSNTEPNPLLMSIPERDITTPSGKCLTLVNPAYLLRLVHQSSDNNTLNETKITSLSVINPINQPDAWEVKALGNVIRTRAAYNEIVKKDNQEYLRYLAPFISNNTCIKCHHDEGAKDGHIRGGISQSIALNKYYAITQKSLLTIVPVHLFSLLLGIILISIGRNRIHHYASLHQIALKKSHANEVNLHLKNNELKQLNESLNHINDEFKHKNDELSNARQALIQQHTRLRAITLLNQAIIKTKDEEHLWRTISSIMVRVLKYNNAATLKIKNQIFELISCTNKQGDDSIKPMIANYINHHFEMFCNPNIQLNPTNKQLEEYGLKYALSLPVFINSELIGLIVILTESDTAFMMLQDQIFLQRLSKQVTMGIQTIILRDNKQVSDKLIRQQNESLAQLIETRNQLFAIMAHDLRNPFSSVINLSSLLDDNFEQYDDDKKRLFIHAINETATKALMLTDNLLDWGRMQQFDIESNKETTHINKLLKDSIEDILPNANQKQISIVFKPMDDYKIVVNPYMFRSACRNILINSIKFTNKNGWININTRSDKQYIYIEIEDNGIGISPDTMSKLFKVEFKTTSQGTAGESGTGLGLLLCRDLIHRLSGTLDIESNQNIGTKVTITMPIAPENVAAITNKA